MTSDPLPAIGTVILRYFPDIYATMVGADHETIATILLHRFGVVLPCEIRSADDAAQVRVGMQVIERAAMADYRR